MFRVHFYSNGLFFLICISASLFFYSCMSFRSEMEGTNSSESSKNIQLAPATVFFYFTHLEQEKGFDVVPKIVPPRRGFRDIFGESMKLLSNVKSFATYTDNDNDIDNVERRKLRDSLKSFSDVTIHITFKRENSFAKHVLASIFSYGSAALFPMGYSWEYIVTADVVTSSGKIVKSYSRTSVLTTWYHAIFLFVYPFLPSEVKIEEIYLESMQSIFKQIEADAVLSR
jgi:hypothetical protein